MLLVRLNDFRKNFSPVFETSFIVEESIFFRLNSETFGEFSVDPFGWDDCRKIEPVSPQCISGLIGPYELSIFPFFGLE